MLHLFLRFHSWQLAQKIFHENACSLGWKFLSKIKEEYVRYFKMLFWIQIHTRSTLSAIISFPKYLLIHLKNCNAITKNRKTHEQNEICKYWQKKFQKKFSRNRHVKQCHSAEINDGGIMVFINIDLIVAEVQPDEELPTMVQIIHPESPEEKPPKVAQGTSPLPSDEQHSRVVQRTSPMPPDEQPPTVVQRISPV